MSDPIVSTALRIHVSYADFCIERGKLANARKIYVKAIQLSFSDSDRSYLWNQFLNLMHKINKSDELTIDQLFLAVQQQLIATTSADTNSLSVVSLIPPPSIACTSITPDHSILLHAPPTTVAPAVPSKSSLDKSTPLHPSLAGGLSALSPNASNFLPYSEAESKAAETMDVSIAVGDDLDSVQGLTPEVVVKMFNRRPPMIFSALNRVSKVYQIFGFK